MRTPARVARCARVSRRARAVPRRTRRREPDARGAARPLGLPVSAIARASDDPVNSRGSARTKYCPHVSEQNLEVARRWIACFNAADADALSALTDPDIEWRDRMHAPDAPEVLHGLAALEQLAAQWEAAYESLTVEVLDYIDADPWVICVSRWEAQTKDGMAVEVRSVDAYEVEDGKVKRSWGGYPDLQSAQDALGIAE
jgi:ketosteroid isomerase-like protein